jgi:hypothetical protein
MSTLLCKPGKFFALLGLLATLSGCQHLDAIRMEADRPGDFAALIGAGEYGRAEQLLTQYPSLDTPDTRRELEQRIDGYEMAVLSDARTRESNDDLYGANQMLTQALLKLPNSVRLNEYKSRLDAERAERLKDNERRELLADTEYYLAQQDIYTERLNLDAPNLVQRWKNSYSQKQAHEMAAKLLACGEETLREERMDVADRCLHYARAIIDTPEVRVALAQLDSRRSTQRHEEEQKVRVIETRREKMRVRKYRDKTQEVLAKTQQALDDNDLPAARRLFLELPPGGNDSHEVAATRTRLDNAIRSRVRKLMIEGDRQYRADNVNRAIRAWEPALELEPGNPELVKRLERARRVLARLEELKNRQHAPVRPAGAGT